MAEFNREEAQQFQDQVIEKVREMEQVLDRDVIQYYREDRVDNETDYYENLRGLKKYLRDAYLSLDRILTDIDRRLG